MSCISILISNDFLLIAILLVEIFSSIHFLTLKEKFSSYCLDSLSHASPLQI